MVRRMIMVVAGLMTLAGAAQAAPPSLPEGTWSGDITPQCTMDAMDAGEWNLRNPHFDMRCASGRCFAQLSCELYNKDTNERETNLFPGWEDSGYRTTIVGWGPIQSPHIEAGHAVSHDDPDSPDGDRSPEAVDAYLEGLTLVFLPNDNVSISINHTLYKIRCNGIVLPKL
ncbi:MAG: hypothetical protein OXE76_02270 [Alphaproteobacteria bacterium]|nr:hypothetical protein [Alphaproteobacteria bacterium]